MSEEQPPRPTTDDDRDAWRAYWKAQGMPWRTEPEIDAQRQRYLVERRAIKPNSDKEIYPFGIRLTRADVEWLLATHESGGMRGPVDWSDDKQRHRQGLDLRGANLAGVDLQDLPLARTRGGHHNGDWLQVASTHSLRARASVIILYAAKLEETQLQGAILGSAVMIRAKLRGAHLEGAFLLDAHLEEAVLAEANLQGACLDSSHLQDAVLQQACLDGADLRRSALSDGTILSKVALGNARLTDVRWDGANLAAVDWKPGDLKAAVDHAQLPSAKRERRGKGNPRQPVVLGDELVARQSKDADTRLRDYEDAVRANRQLATVLRGQGLNEDADRFAYRAQALQRQVLRRQMQWLRWFGSLLLDVVAGYGYRPLRSLLSYLLVVGAFALVYFALGGAHGQPLSWNEALVVSLTAFHGRGFFTSAFQPGDLQAAVAAIEAVFGLLIEITFIATFTQRFFAR